MVRLFPDLIAKNLDAGRKLAEVHSALGEERTIAELREQFIAVLAHDLSAPVRAISVFVDLLTKSPLNERAVTMVQLMRGSTSRMLTLIDNLLDLARSRQGGGLTLSREADEPLEPMLRTVITELSVANAGDSIEPRALERLFQPFYRNALVNDREGLGLGLYISHEIATAHGGTLAVNSTPEETRFTFRMPLL